jgi:hypothetical protein
LAQPGHFFFFPPSIGTIIPGLSSSNFGINPSNIPAAWNAGQFCLCSDQTPTNSDVLGGISRTPDRSEVARHVPMGASGGKKKDFDEPEFMQRQNDRDIWVHPR